MATVYVTFAQCGAAGAFGDVESAVQGSNARSETITSSVASAQGTLTARTREMARVVCASHVYATTGTNPTAAAATGVYCPAGQVTTIAMAAGDKLAVIDV